MLAANFTKRIARPLALCMALAVFTHGSFASHALGQGYTRSYLNELDSLWDRLDSIRIKINEGDTGFVDCDAETEELILDSSTEIYHEVKQYLEALDEFQYCEAEPNDEAALRYAIKELKKEQVDLPSEVLTRQTYQLAIDVLELFANKIAEYSTESKCIKSAVHDDPAALFRLAVLKGFDDPEGAVWLEKAADRGIPKCMYLMGEYCYESVGRQHETPDWMQMAINEGHSNPRCFLILGICYLDGVGVKKSKAKGMEHLRQAAAQDEPVSMIVLATEALQKNDFDSAFEWVERAALLGLPEGMEALSTFYRKGLGTPVDLDSAKYWAEQASNASNELNVKS